MVWCGMVWYGLVFVFFFAIVARVNILPQKRLTLHSSLLFLSLTLIPPASYKIFKIGYQLWKVNWITCFTLSLSLRSLSLSIRFNISSISSQIVQFIHATLYFSPFSSCPSFFWYSWHANDIFYQRTKRPILCLNWVKYGTSFLPLGYIKWGEVFCGFVTWPTLSSWPNHLANEICECVCVCE